MKLQPVVSSVPQPRSEAGIDTEYPTESRRITTPNQSKVQVRTVAAPQLTAKEAKKAAKEKEKK